MRKAHAKTIKALVILSVFVFSFVVPVRPAHAQGPVGVAAGGAFFLFKQKVYDKVSSIIPDIDITQTVMNIVTTLITDAPLAVLWQRNGDEVGACAIYWLVERSGADQIAANLTCLGLEGEAAVTAVEDALAAAALLMQEDPEVCNFATDNIAGRNGGSLAGFAMTLNGAVQEPLPVNLAVFFRDYARRIPIVKDTAFAQPRYTYVLGENFVLDIWKKVRNISYGIMSVAMLVVGVMIMTRKKLNPQVVVTIQNALPRIILSLVLITFSFPIGAVLTSLTLPLMGMVAQVFFAEALGDLMRMDLLPVLFTYLISMFKGAGMFAMAFMGILMIATVVLIIIALLKVLLTYLQLLTGIVLAPLQFAIGAIPGMEGSTTKWFKSMIAKVLSVPAMFFMIGLAWYLMFRAFTENIFICGENTADPLTYMGELGGNFMSHQGTLLVLPLFMLFCLVTSMKVPKMIENAIMGDPRKR